MKKKKKKFDSTWLKSREVLIKRNTVILNLVSLTLIDNMIIMIVLIIDNV